MKVKNPARKEALRSHAFKRMERPERCDAAVNGFFKTHAFLSRMYAVKLG